MDDPKIRELNRLRNQLARLTNDPVEEWIREFAETLTDTQKAAKLLTIANGMRADRRKFCDGIGAAIALLED